MFDVVKNWGVWLETVEITDVVISSGSLFKDLQAEFREKMKKESALYEMVVQQEIDEVKQREELIIQKKRNESKIEINIYGKMIDMEIAAETELQQADKAVIMNQRAQMQNASTLFTKKAQAEYDAKVQDEQNEMSILRV